MTTSHKQNPFGILEHSDSSDDEDFHKNKKAKPAQKDSKTTNQSSNKPKEATKGNDQKKAPLKVSAPGDESKEKHLKSKEQRKVKLSDEPHPKDRQSGTGISAFDKKAKRGGGGRFNVGTVQEELKDGGKEAVDQEKEDVVEEVEDKSITLEEYLKKQGGTQEAQVNDAKSKITTNDLLKEMGTATKLQNRHDIAIDDKKEIQRKKKEEYISTADLGLNTKNADLLGFKTGFKTFADRKPLQEKAPAQTQVKEEVQSPDAKEGATEEKKEGDVKGDDQKGGDRKGGYKGKKNYGGNGNSYKPREREEKQVKPNFEDNSLFPKLG